MAKKRLGELLVEAGLISTEQLNYALGVHRNSSEKLGQILMRTGYVAEDIVLEFLGKQHSTSSINPYKEVIDQRAVYMIPRAVAEKHKVIAVGFKVNRGIKKLIIAMANPSDVEVINSLEFITGYSVDPVFAREEDLVHVIRHYYHRMRA